MKSAIDLGLAAIGLILAAPVIAIAAGLVKLSSAGPAFFTQERAGKHGKVFRIYKLRTMVDARDVNGRLLPDPDRLTRIGKVLRATSIDELPQFWNILRGEMSLLGPRPLPVCYLERYTSEQMRRHEVLPGMGSYSDVVFNRTVTDWAAVFESDVWYVDHWSLWMDTKLFFVIAVMVLTRRGTEQGAAGLMPEFRPKIHDERTEAEGAK